MTDAERRLLDLLKERSVRRAPAGAPLSAFCSPAAARPERVPLPRGGELFAGVARANGE
jgi:hypothetical protein